MKFETFKECHLCLIEVSLFSGKVHKGIITSHSFVNYSSREVAEISIMEEWSIVRINCKEIKSIRKVNQQQG